MPNSPQSFANHTRWQPPIHYFVVPVMLLNFLYSIYLFYRTPAISSGWWIVMSLALIVLVVFVRLNPLKAQDRIIRLEEQLRYQRVLSSSLLERTGALTLGQIIALRFAADDELEELVAAVLAGRFVKNSEIKRAIKDWRADNLRV
jgi:Family of unknown function (DUF6526)